MVSMDVLDFVEIGQRIKIRVIDFLRNCFFSRQVDLLYCGRGKQNAHCTVEITYCRPNLATGRLSVELEVLHTWVLATACVGECARNCYSLVRR